MSDVENHTVRLLQAMREEMAQGFADARARTDALEQRMDSGFAEVNRRLDAQQRVMQGESILGRYAVADVEERLVTIEQHLGFPAREA